MPPHPLLLPSHQEFQNIPTIAYDYPVGVTLEALAESPIETPLGRTESLYTAFSRAFLGYPTWNINKPTIERL